MKQITDPDEILRLCKVVIDAYPKLVRRYQQGKEADFQKIFYRTFELSNKKASIPLVVTTLKKLLKP